jgi:hypothetical protein
MSPFELSDWARALVKLAEAREQESRTRAAFYDELLAIGCPDLAVDCVASGEEPCLAINEAWRWGRLTWGTVVLAGKPGRGKTVAAVRYAAVKPKGLANPRAFVTMWVEAERLEELEGWDRRKAKLIAAPRLVINDVPRRISAMAGKLIGHVLAVRGDLGRPSLVTTNLTQPEFAELVDLVADPADSPVLDRIRRGAWIEITGPSRRDPDEVPGGHRRALRITRDKAFVRLVELAGAMVRGDVEDRVSKAALRGAREAYESEVSLDGETSVCAALQRLLGVSDEQVRETIAELEAERERIVLAGSLSSQGRHDEAFAMLREEPEG